jgi:hypothetical protein
VSSFIEAGKTGVKDFLLALVVSEMLTHRGRKFGYPAALRTKGYSVIDGGLKV